MVGWSSTRVPLLVAVLCALSPGSAPAYEGQAPDGGAGEVPAGAPEPWTPAPRDVYPVGERTAKWVQQALEHVADQDYPAAREALSNLRVAALNPHERAQAFRAYGYIEYGEQDLPGSIDYLEKAIAEDALGVDANQELRFQVAQLHAGREDWPGVVKSLGIWFAGAAKPNSAAYYLLALAHFQMQDIDAALAPARTAVELADEPQESWLQLLLAIRLMRKEYPEAVPVLEELVRSYPKKDYWLQLSTVHGALGRFQEALIPLQLAYEQGLLTEGDEVRRLGQLLLYLELPYRAAHVLDRGLEERQIEGDAEVYELLSNAWISAREFELAIGPLERAARLSDRGDTFVRLAQVLIQRERWAPAIEALEHALEKGDLTRPGEAHLLMGIARYSRQQPRQAIPAFERASEYEDTRSEASNWLAHIERELDQG